MTDGGFHTPDPQSTASAELQQRLARLQARRGQPADVSTDSATDSAATRVAARAGSAPARPYPVRQQPARRAVGAKIGTLGASATAVFGLMALYGVAEQRRNQTTDETNPADQFDQFDQRAPVVQPTGQVQSAGEFEQAQPVAVTVSTVLAVESAPAPAVVVVDGDGNVLAAPDDLDPVVLAEAVARHQVERATLRAATASPSTLAPIAEPATVDLAIPKPPPPAPRRVQRKSSKSGRSSGRASSPAPAPAPAPKPQSKSSGS